MVKLKFLLMSVALLALSAVQLHAAKELKLAARYDYSPDGQLQSVLTPVSDNGAVKASYSRSYLGDGKVKVTVHKKNLEFNELAFDPGAKHRTGEGLHDYNEKFALCQVASKGDIVPGGLDKGILVREYVEKGGRKLEETSMLGNKIEYKYNNKGQLVKILSGSEGASPDEILSTSFAYDKNGRLSKTQDALERVSGQVYNPEGRVAEMINPLDEKSFVSYDKYGRVISKSGAGAYPLSFEYDSFGEIIAYTDGNGSITKFEYDNSGRLARRIWADGSVISYSYNNNGLLSKKLEGKRTTIYEYDEFNRLAKIEIYQNPHKSVTTLKHDSNGKLVEISDENGKIIFSYDNFGRMTSEKGSVGEIHYEYNSQGFLSAKLCVLDSKEFKTTYSYDNFDRITQVSSPTGAYSYKYDNKGRIASLSFGDVTIKNDYDKAGRLVSKSLSPAVNGERSTVNGTLLCTYEYDKLDRRIKAELNGVKWIYGYDENNQLTSASSSDGYVYGYDFDKIGNRKYAFFSEKGLGKIKTDFEYNALNQIANQGFQYDAHGNLIKSQDTEYVYDLHDRLIEVKKPNITVKYGYDPLGQRIKSEEFTADGAKIADTKNTKVTQFLMSGMVEQARITDSVAQYHTLGLDLAQSLTATGGVGAVLASTSFSVSSNTDTLTPASKASNDALTLSYLYDGNGNVIAATDSTGTITTKLAYSPFGEQIYGPNLPFTFSTKAVDASSLAYYGARYYSMRLGRWLNKDKTYEFGGINFYGFCMNIPLTYFDVLGFYPVNGTTFEEVDDSILQHMVKNNGHIATYTFDENSVKYDIINIHVIVEWTEDVSNNQCSGCKIYKTNCSGNIHYTSYSDYTDLPELGLNVSFNLDEWRAWADFYNAVLVHEWGHKEVTNSILGVDHYIDGFGESCDGFEYSRASCDSNLYQNSVQYNASLLDTLENSQLEYDSNNTNPVGLPSEYLE